MISCRRIYGTAFAVLFQSGGRTMDIAIVTGASSGLGSEFARRLDEEGLDEIWVSARRRERLESLAAHLKTSARIVDGDVTDVTFIDRLRSMLKKGISVRYLINAAGYGRIGGAIDIDAMAEAGMIDVNCKALLLITRAVLPYMHSGARIGMLCSAAAFQPIPYIGTYAATKAFVLSYSRSLGEELRQQGIYVTAICPYWVKDTEFVSTAKKYTDGFIKRLPFANHKTYVVSKALNDMKHGRSVSTPGLMATIDRYGSAVLPTGLIMRLSRLLMG